MRIFFLTLIYFFLHFHSLPADVGIKYESRTRAEEITAKDSNPDIVVFVRKGCSHCQNAKKFLQSLQAEHPELRIVFHDVAIDPKAQDDLIALAKETPNLPLAVPTFLLRGRILSGFSGPEGTGKQIRQILGLDKTPKSTFLDQVDLPFIGKVNMKDYSFPVFTIIIGLIDGVNPCAMWILLFLITFLIHFRSRRKMFLVAGTFIIISGMVYFLFMTAWLNFFIILGSARWIQIILGVVAVAAGSVHIKDYFAFKKGISLSIPDSAKPWIGKRIGKILEAKSMVGTLIAVSALAFLVNAVELLCTAGLPAIYTQILASKGLHQWQYYGYLLLYNIAYMFDDMVVLLIAILTLNPQRLSEKKGLYLKFFSGLIMIGLGVLLLFKPEWLNWT